MGYMHLWVPYSWGPEEGTGSSGPEVKGLCVSLMSVRMVLCKNSTCSLRHWAISLALMLIYKRKKMSNYGKHNLFVSGWHSGYSLLVEMIMPMLITEVLIKREREGKMAAKSIPELKKLLSDKHPTHKKSQWQGAQILIFLLGLISIALKSKPELY